MTKQNWLALIPLVLIVLLIGSLALVFSQASQFTHGIDPVFVDLGFAQIRYYGLVYFFGFLAAYWLLARRIKRGELALKKEELENLILLIVLAVVVGSRLVEVVFYNPGHYLERPLDIIKIWEGGLSFHGGLAGVIFVCWRFARKKGIPLLSILDALVLPLAFFLCLGRFANFINGELYGAETTLPWGVKFKSTLGYHHPSQIYESLKNLLIFGVLYFVNSFKPRVGTLTFTFLGLYGVIRFVIEFLKNYGKYGYNTIDNFLGMNMAQLLCLAMVIVSVWGFLRLRKQAQAAKG